MSPHHPQPQPPPPEVPKVYLLPNLMTAGNLFCGFMAILKIIEGMLQEHGSVESFHFYKESLWWILGAFLFDMLDGRLARLGGKDSAFGREFDSLADVVSFGLAPALLVHKIILADLPEKWRALSWIIAFFYLLAGAMRLARFNVVSSQPQQHSNKDFLGFPIPAAAGLVASLTLMMLTYYEEDRNPGKWKFVLPVVLAFLSYMMYSKIWYPSFKSVNWKSQRSIPQILLIVLVIIVMYWFRPYSLAFAFMAYLVYGFVRPFISKRIRKEIEEEEEEEVIGT
jgi:CDP-diacylglycerol---serine O-phosphatidyltransferase